MERKDVETKMRGHWELKAYTLLEVWNTMSDNKIVNFSKKDTQKSSMLY